MLVITKGWQNEEREEEDRNYIWHLGESVPNTARVVNLQVDGDELNLILYAMYHSGKQHGIVYRKNSGFWVED